MREALESHAAGLAAANRTDAELADIRAVLESLRNLTSAFDLRCTQEDYFNDLAKADVGFHMSIVNAGKNQLLRAEILRLHLKLRDGIERNRLHHIDCSALQGRDLGAVSAQ